MFKIEDIPNYDNLFIRDGEWVFVVNKHSGEISHKLSVLEYADFWCKEWKENEALRTHLTKGYFLPKPNPDTAENIQELRMLCSDKSRHRKGDTSFLFDFMLRDECTKAESKLFLYLTRQVEVWNYSIIDYNSLPAIMNLSERQVRNIWKSLQEKGLISVVNTQFSTDEGWGILVKLHPKLYWEGRYSAWAAKCKNNYEYEDAIALE